jgi:hypothetical protein
MIQNLQATRSNGVIALHRVLVDITRTAKLKVDEFSPADKLLYVQGSAIMCSFSDDLISMINAATHVLVPLMKDPQGAAAFNSQTVTPNLWVELIATLDVLLSEVGRCSSTLINYEKMLDSKGQKADSTKAPLTLDLKQLFKQLESDMKSTKDKIKTWMNTNNKNTLGKSIDMKEASLRAKIVTKERLKKREMVKKLSPTQSVSLHSLEAKQKEMFTTLQQLEQKDEHRQLDQLVPKVQNCLQSNVKSLSKLLEALSIEALDDDSSDLMGLLDTIFKANEPKTPFVSQRFEARRFSPSTAHSVDAIDIKSSSSASKQKDKEKDMEKMMDDIANFMDKTSRVYDSQRM